MLVDLQEERDGTPVCDSLFSPLQHGQTEALATFSRVDTNRQYFRLIRRNPDQNQSDMAAALLDRKGPG